ncbi:MULTISPECIES: permease [Halorussus]|uniref:permease n=1 Tax=Halorussus TaxID=1070314 RepID=UPI00209E98B5|nr:permease [Halorussus vallis]USZ74274.1 permease [Halorussus vallis]
MVLVDSLLEGLGLALSMAWETWWALVLGFTITGAVEEFVSEEQMTAYLGGDGWREVGLGTLFGALSSSCSFSAVATAKTLFKKGASGVAALAAFQFAATDLVAELGLVMWILLGWQFVAADFVGGVIAVGVLAYVYRKFVPDEWFEVAREHALALDEITCPACGVETDPTDDDAVKAEFGGETRYFCCGGCLRAYRNRTETAEAGGSHAAASDPRDDLTSLAGWKQAATNAVREWDMLWEDIAAGFLLAGLIAGFVPRSWWTSLFGVGAEGTLTWVLSNAVLGVVVGVVTFICSVGNVPFALVLWSNGVAFGSVISFIFADLIIPPIVNAYRRYYGTRMAAVIFGATALAAVVAGVVVHYLFGFFGLIPPEGVTGGTAPDGYTLVLNLLFTPLFLAQVGATYGHEAIGERLVALPGDVGPYVYRVYRAVGPTKAALGALAAGAVGLASAMWVAGGHAAALGRALGRAVRAVGEALAKAFDRFAEAYRRLREE